MFCLFPLIVDAADLDVDSADYFKALSLIRKPPKAAIAISACDSTEKNKILGLLKKNDKINLENGIEQITVFKGDFSNQGFTEYAIVTSEGSIHWNEVTVFKLVNNELIDLDLNQMIANNFYQGKIDMMTDYSQREFSNHIAEPFAIKLKGKTYLRFMEYPGGRMDYDKTKLMLCTYLWEGNKFTLVGPNLAFSKSTGKLIETKHCPNRS